MPPLSDIDPTDSSHDGFSLLQHGHKDMVQATAFNAYGDRFASSSVDGKIKVYNRHKDGTWNLCDTWGAHTAEILQVAIFLILYSFLQLRFNGVSPWFGFLPNFELPSF
jgi:nucleoporin SEH1